MSGWAGRKGSVTPTVVTGNVHVGILGQIQLLDSREPPRPRQLRKRGTLRRETTEKLPEVTQTAHSCWEQVGQAAPGVQLS